MAQFPKPTPLQATGLALAATALAVLTWPAARHGLGQPLFYALLLLHLVLDYRAQRGPDNPFRQSLTTLYQRAKAGQLPRSTRWDDVQSLLVFGALIMVMLDPG